MPAFKLNAFSGIRPRLPESLLPQGAATIAQNCDFAYGELRHTKGGFQFLDMSNNPKSIYTDDGLKFYTWTNANISAVRTPLANDSFNRLYYTGDGGLKVTDRTATRTTGGPPASAYLVGVPKPSTAPGMQAVAPTAATSSNATLTFTFHYEYGGVKYQEQAITPTTVSSTQYRFTPPALNTNTPERAAPVLRLKAVWKNTGELAFDLYTESSTLDSTNDSSYQLSMSPDSTGGTYTATLTAAIKESDKETRAYVYTYVNSYNEEGPPSPPATVDTAPNGTVNVTVTRDSGYSSYSPITEIRIYRTPTGTAIADYFYVGSLSVMAGAGSYEFVDNVAPEMLNEALASTNYYPPDQALEGLMSLPNGILCAWKGNELHFSEAYKPWAWPPQYVKTLTHPVVGGIVHGSGAVITTTSSPYIVSGVSPDSMTVSRINVDQAGVSRQAIGVVDGAVVYASHDGLVTISGASASLKASERFFTREVWRSRYGAAIGTMYFADWDGRLVVFSTTGSFTPFMIRTDEADGTMTDLPDLVAACAFVSPLSDQFYYAHGNAIYQFQGGADQTAVWQSREQVAPKPVCYAVAQAVVVGSWTVEFWADGVLRHSQSVADGTHTFRLPGGFKAYRWKIKISGSGRFRELSVSTSVQEMARI